jgi:hypothetical protein
VLSLLRAWCRHKTLTRVKQGGVWCWSCACGYTVPIVKRTAEETARAQHLLGRAS